MIVKCSLRGMKIRNNVLSLDACFFRPMIWAKKTNFKMTLCNYY